MKKLRLPPGGRALSGLIRAYGTLPEQARNVWCFAGSESWAASVFRRKSGLSYLVLPPNENPEDFQWPVAAGEITMIDCNADDRLLMRTGRSLLDAGASLVAVCRPTGETAYWRRPGTTPESEGGDNVNAA